MLIIEDRNPQRRTIKKSISVHSSKQRSLLFERKMIVSCLGGKLRRRIIFAPARFHPEEIDRFFPYPPLPVSHCQSADFFQISWNVYIAGGDRASSETRDCKSFRNIPGLSSIFMNPIDRAPFLSLSLSLSLSLLALSLHHSRWVCRTCRERDIRSSYFLRNS